MFLKPLLPFPVLTTLSNITAAKSVARMQPADSQAAFHFTKEPQSRVLLAHLQVPSEASQFALWSLLSVCTVEELTALPTPEAVMRLS